MTRQRAAWWILADGTPLMIRGGGLLLAVAAFGWNMGTVGIWAAIVILASGASRFERMVKTDPDYQAELTHHFRAVEH